MTVKSVTVNFVGDLQKAVADLPADRHVAIQIVAADNTCWNVGADFWPQVPHGTIACLSISHPELLTLPNETILRDAARFRKLMEMHNADDKKSLCIGWYDVHAEKRIDGLGGRDPVAILDEAIARDALHRS